MRACDRSSVWAGPVFHLSNGLVGSPERPGAGLRRRGGGRRKERSKKMKDDDDDDDIHLELSACYQPFYIFLFIAGFDYDWYS